MSASNVVLQLVKSLNKTTCGAHQVATERLQPKRKTELFPESYETSIRHQLSGCLRFLFNLRLLLTVSFVEEPKSDPALSFIK